MRTSQYVMPFGYDETLFSVANQLKSLKPLSVYPNLKIGRELAETRINERLTDSGCFRFIKIVLIFRAILISFPHSVKL